MNTTIISSTEYQPRDVWMRYTDNTGKAHVMEHRVLDRDNFVAIKIQQSALERTRHDTKKGEKPLAKAEEITKAQYLAERGK